MTIGIYKIVNIINNKIYVGKSTNIEIRWQRHKNDLRRNKHDNIYLQRSYNTHGIDSFEFSIIEECSVDTLLEREQHYLDQIFESGNTYNMSTRSLSGGSVKRTQEQKDHLSKIHTGKKLSQATKDKLSKANKGKTLSENTKQKISETMKKRKAIS